VKNSSAQMALPFEFDDVGMAAPSRADSVSSIEWSYSKRDVLNQCPLRYYFSYYGSSKRVAKGETRKDELSRLKNMDNRYLRSGSLLHLAISRYFNAAQNGQPLSLLELTDWARWKFQADIRYSQTGELPRNSNPKYPPSLLREFVFDSDHADELCRDAEERMIAALTAFYSDARFEEFRIAGSQTDSVIERMIRLQSLPCRVVGKIDLAYPLARGAVVVDWKSGSADSFGEDSLQLAIYGLWAIEHFGCDPTDLKVYKVFLSSREIVPFSISAALLEDAKIRVVQDAERMATLDAYGRDGIHAAFTPRLSKNICRLCEYEAICYA